MRSKRALLIAGVSSLFLPTAGLAHHSLGTQFNTQKTIELTCAVKKMDWRNPHVRLYIDVEDEGNTVTWEVDMGSPSQQFMAGWRIDTYRRGDLVKVEAYPARNGSNIVFGTRVEHLRR
jgi:hypothetical protein